jgi:hypothetical protein
MRTISRLAVLFSIPALVFGICFTPNAATAAVIEIEVSTLDGSQGVTFDPAGTTPSVSSEGFHAKGLAANGDFTIIRFTPEAIGLPGLLLGQIAGTQYDAKTNVAGWADWRVKTYTVGEGGAPFGVRVESPTTFSGTDWTNHNLQAFDRITAGDGSFDVQGDIATIVTHFMAAANQQILYFEITAGATDVGYAHDYDALINNLTVSFYNGIDATVVIRAVPEPASFGLLTLPLLTLLRRRSA